MQLVTELKYLYKASNQGALWDMCKMSVKVISQNSKYKLEGKILHQQCNRLFPARCQTYAN